jgi:hypothetical protein
MRRQSLLFLLAAISLPAALSAMPVEINTAAIAHQTAYTDLEVSLRLVGGTGAVLMPGRSVNLTFQTNADACVIIYNIDVDGNINLLYPADGRPRMIQGRKVQFLPEQGSGIVWEAGGRTGIEYIHAIAVDATTRIDADELAYLARNASLPDGERLKIDMDPFLAFNMIDEELVGEAEQMPPATDYTYFYINRKVDYPGYLCYQCHSPSKIPDPYNMKCTEVVIEKIEGNEGAAYPYPNLYAIAHMDEWYEDSETYTYDAGAIGLDYDDGGYDDSKVYLSIYYGGGYYPYYYGWSPYWYGWPSWGWGVSWGSYWGWNVSWGWGGYWHHYPYCSWYPYGYYPYYYGWGHWGWDNGCYPHSYCYGRGHDYPSRSLYAGRSFNKRPASIDYHATAVKLDRNRAIASSRLTRERTRSYTQRTLERSELARRVAREQTRAHMTTLDGRRQQTGRSRDYVRDGIGTRAYNARSTRGSTPATDRSTRSFDRARSRTGSGIERRFERSAREREATNARSRSRPTRDSGTTRARERSSAPARNSRDSGSSTRSRSSERPQPAKTQRSNDSGRSSSGSKSSTRSSSSRSTPVSRPSGGSSRGSSGGSSSRGSSGGSSRGSSGGKSGRK